MENRISDDYRGRDGTGWKCDVCGKVIARAGDGCVQLIEIETELTESEDYGQLVNRELKIVHRPGVIPMEDETGTCFNDGPEHCTFLLTDLLRPNGLAQMFEWIATAELPVEEVIALTRRLHLPAGEDDIFD